MDYLINVTKMSGNPHKHKNYEIIVCTEGCGTFFENKKETEVFPGKIIIVPPGTVHHSTTDDEMHERIYINGEFNHIFKLTSPAIITDNEKGEGLTLAKIIYNNRFANREYITALVGALAHFLLSRIKMEDEIFLAVKNIVGTIKESFYNYDIDLNSLLGKSGYSEDYIRAEFKKITGVTPTEFLTKTRVFHACYLIETYRNTVPLTAIAEQCGYTDYVYFSRRFKHITGVSPRKYMEDVVTYE